MAVYSQDKKHFVPAIDLHIEPHWCGSTGLRKFCVVSKGVILGSYPSCERAKEVLHGIINNQFRVNLDVGTYQIMPAEEK
jgi:hypothetical protein